MAELEIHHEGEESDPSGKKIGALAAILAVFLAIVTIASHRAHTEGIMLKTEASDDWNFYQAKKLKSHNLELGEDLIALLAPKGDDSAVKKLQEYKAGVERYERESKEASDTAKEKDGEAAVAEHQALRFDFGEGLLEIGLVLSSLYFISKRMMFPIVGVIAGLAGLAVAATGLLVH